MISIRTKVGNITVRTIEDYKNSWRTYIYNNQLSNAIKEMGRSDNLKDAGILHLKICKEITYKQITNR